MLKKSIIRASVLLFFFVGLSRLFGIGEGRLESVSSVVVYPFLVVHKAITRGFNNWRVATASHASLLKDLETSLTERDKLQQELIQLKALVHYQDRTKEIHAFLDRYKTNQCTIVQVLFKNFDGSHFFLIDAGSSQGITSSMIAVYKDCLVGRVTEVYPSYSKVLLITDPGCKVAALCAETNAQGIHEGIMRLDCTKLNYVNHLDEIKKGDLVLSSGEGLVFPHGFGLGRIQSEERNNHNYRILLTPLLDLKKLDYCCVVANDIQLVTQQNIDDHTTQ